MLLLIDPPKSTTILHVVTSMKYMKEAKQSNMKIRVGSTVTAKIEEMEEKTREGRIRMTRKEVKGKNKFLVQF